MVESWLMRVWSEYSVHILDFDFPRSLKLTMYFVNWNLSLTMSYLFIYLFLSEIESDFNQTSWLFFLIKKI